MTKIALWAMDGGLSLSTLDPCADVDVVLGPGIVATNGAMPELGEAADQVAWLCWVGTTSNLIPAMIFGN